MARRPNFTGGEKIESKPKLTRQGCGSHNKYASTIRNQGRKQYLCTGK